MRFSALPRRPGSTGTSMASETTSPTSESQIDSRSSAASARDRKANSRVASPTAPARNAPTLARPCLRNTAVEERFFRDTMVSPASPRPMFLTLTLSSTSSPTCKTPSPLPFLSSTQCSNANRGLGRLATVTMDALETPRVWLYKSPRVTDTSSARGIISAGSLIVVSQLRAPPGGMYPKTNSRFLRCGLSELVMP